SGAADAVRRRIANEGASEFARAVLKDLHAVWPDVVETTPIAITDDKTANSFSVTLHYEIRNCWKGDSASRHLIFRIVDDAVSGELQPVKGGQRETQIYLGSPRKITRILRLNMPSSWTGDGWRNLSEAGSIKFMSSLRVEGQTLTHWKELVVGAWSLPASQAG